MRPISSYNDPTISPLPLLSPIDSTASCFHCARLHRALHSFPTRRSSDLHPTRKTTPHTHHSNQPLIRARASHRTDRKSTRLNSSHVAISYAVFCLKKKNAIYHGNYQYIT